MTHPPAASYNVRTVSSCIQAAAVHCVRLKKKQVLENKSVFSVKIHVQTLSTASNKDSYAQCVPYCALIRLSVRHNHFVSFK